MVPSPIAAMTVSRSRKTGRPPSPWATRSAIGKFESTKPAMFWVVKITPLR